MPDWSKDGVSSFWYKSVFPCQIEAKTVYHLSGTKASSHAGLEQRRCIIFLVRKLHPMLDWSKDGVSSFWYKSLFPSRIGAKPCRNQALSFLIAALTFQMAVCFCE
jgi:hypothetical protein